MNRLENIKNYGLKKAEAEFFAEMNRRQYLAEKTEEIESLWSRVEELLVTARACKMWDIKIPESVKWVFRYYQSTIYGRMCLATSDERKEKGVMLVSQANHKDYVYLLEGKVEFPSDVRTFMLDDFADALADLENKFYGWVDETTAD